MFLFCAHGPVANLEVSQSYAGGGLWVDRSGEGKTTQSPLLLLPLTPHPHQLKGRQLPGDPSNSLLIPSNLSNSVNSQFQ